MKKKEGVENANAGRLKLLDKLLSLTSVIDLDKRPNVKLITFQIIFIFVRTHKE